MLHWRRIKSVEQAATFVKEMLTEHLQRGERVLWLVPGGSAADIAVEAAKQLVGRTDLNKLTVTLTDERFGPVGHMDSNWRQLLDKGFQLDSVKMRPALKGFSKKRTTEDYSRLLNQELVVNDYSVALAGLGPDGHIFGIKPGSPAINSSRDVESYGWGDFSRLTPTFNLLQKLDEVIIYAAGKEKWAQFEQLETNISPNDQPAQFLKSMKKVIILNDYKGEFL